MQVIHIKMYYSLIPKKLNHVIYHMKNLHNQKTNCEHIIFSMNKRIHHIKNIFLTYETIE
jgi:hypothetical protein